MINFWQVHSILFLICITFFPRLTMLFAVPLHFGLLEWLGWLFVPHVLVAILATTYYWHTNPILCIIAWFVALGGTGTEAKVVTYRRVSIWR
jgi:hypothetical protein